MHARCRSESLRSKSVSRVTNSICCGWSCLVCRRLGQLLFLMSSSVSVVLKSCCLVVLVRMLHPTNSAPLLSYEYCMSFEIYRAVQVLLCMCVRSAWLGCLNWIGSRCCRGCRPKMISRRDCGKGLLGIVDVVLKKGN
ncbi:hypothetical protein QBC45DRAFT_1148 [Copromyces sp. CBS 386.78]|nr:hypothetical protein QBC45DRAFT_1148 [Copromyces sp. CBS 386.78]